MSENDLVNRARGEAFVGGQDELAQLASAAADVARSGRGQMMIIAGDAGMGKSRLVQEFSDQASRDGWTTAAGGCVDVAAGALTYAALIEIFRHLGRHLGREVMAKLAGAPIGHDVLDGNRHHRTPGRGGRPGRPVGRRARPPRRLPLRRPRRLHAGQLRRPRFDVFLRRGDLDAAARTLAPAMERASAMDDAQFSANTRIRAAQLTLATGRLDDARAHISAALAIADRCDDMIYAPKACSVGISAEAASPAPDIGTIEALLARLSGIEALARSFGGQLLAEPAAFAAMARAETRALSGSPARGLASRRDGMGPLRQPVLGRPYAGTGSRRPCSGPRADKNLATRITADALAVARSLGAAPLTADLEVLIRRGRLAADPTRTRPCAGSA